MFSCHTFTETKQRRLYFQPPLLSDNCGAFRNRLGKAIVRGFQTSAPRAGCIGGGGHRSEPKASDISDEGEGFPSHFCRKMHCPKKGLVRTACLACNSCAGLLLLRFITHSLLRSH